MAMDVKAAGAKTADGSRTGKSATNGPGSVGRAAFFKKFQRLPENRFRTTNSDLKVAVVKDGKGMPVLPGMKVEVHYTGWTESGVQFDSSYAKGKTFSFRLGAGRVIKGWEEGIQGMKPGERRQLIVPADLAYGNRKVGKIPPGATLIFNVEAIGVDKGTSNPKGKMSVVA